MRLNLHELTSVFIFILAISISTSISANGTTSAAESLDIYCADDDWVRYSDIHYLNYNDYKPKVHGYGYDIQGPWVDKYINCYEGHIKLTWRIRDHYGHWHYCYTKIWVESDAHYHSDLKIECPYDQWIYCDDLHYYHYPKPKVHSYGHYEIFGPWKEKHLNKCGIGHIKVTWKITDECGKKHYCEYLVKVKGHESGSPVKYWPSSFETDECESNLDPKYLGDHYGYPHLNDYHDCSEYGISYKDEIFYPITSGYGHHDKPEFCFKILRTWTVIDWCNYDGHSYGYGYGSHSYGKWTHTQTIKVKGGSTPMIECPEDVTVSVEGDESKAYVNLDKAVASLSDGSCTDKLNITNDSKYADSHGADASGYYPFGEHWVTFKVTDGCHNQTSCKVKIVVKDIHPPTPYCHTTIVTDIGWHDDGLYTVIDPELFDAGSYDNVTPNHKLKFKVEPEILTCDNIDTNEIKITVIDEFGNENFCTAYLILQDNLGMCPQDSQELLSVSVTGSISTEGGMAVSQALVTFEGEEMVSARTNDNGKFEIRVSKDHNYVIKPQKNIHFMDGVNTLDYITLHNYVSGKQELTSPYKMIAADMDLNGKIDFIDVFKLGSMIINNGQNMPEEAISWRFVDAKHEFSSPTDPLNGPFPEEMEVELKDEDMSSVNFIGVKLGDVDGSLSTPLARLRNDIGGKDLFLELDYSEGIIEVTAKNNDQIQGAKFSFSLNDGQIINVHPQANISIEDNRATVLWIGTDNNGETKLFDIVGMDLSSFVTNGDGEAIDRENRIGSVKTISNGAQYGFKLYQNRPNPFTNQTIIPFEMDQAGNMTLRIKDISGKEIYSMTQYVRSGYHQIKLENSLFKHSGIFYYTLESSSSNQTRRMVLLN